LLVLFTVDPGDPQSDVDPEKVSVISKYSVNGLTEAFAETFSLLQWREKGGWPEIVQQFSRILGGEP
jgi:hypothetical protein